MPVKDVFAIGSTKVRLCNIERRARCFYCDICSPSDDWLIDCHFVLKRTKVPFSIKRYICTQNEKHKRSKPKSFEKNVLIRAEKSRSCPVLSADSQNRTLQLIQSLCYASESRNTPPDTHTLLLPHLSLYIQKYFSSFRSYLLSSALIHVYGHGVDVIFHAHAVHAGVRYRFGRGRSRVVFGESPEVRREGLRDGCRKT